MVSLWRLLGLLATCVALAGINASAATKTWAGTASRAQWDTRNSWAQRRIPHDGDDLVFTGTTQQANNNNIKSLIVGSVTFLNGGFNITGNPLTLTSTFSNTGNNLWGIPITLAGNVTFKSLAGGTLDFDGAIINGGHLLTVDSAGTTRLDGVISGSGGLMKSGAGTLTIGAADTYSGATTVSAGKLVVSGSISGSAVTVNSGATLEVSGSISGGAVTVNSGATLVMSGSGSLGSGSALTVASGATLGGSGTTAGTVTVNGTLAPGSSVGTLNTGAETWNAGGGYTWEINNATGTAGGASGWDLMNITGITGDLNIQSSSGTPFTINVVSRSGTAAGSAANFDCKSGYTWPIATVSRSVQNFNATKFTVNTSQFQNFTGGGTFSVVQNGTSVDVVFKPHACASGDIDPKRDVSWGVTNNAIHIMIQDAYGLGKVEGLRIVNCTMTAKAYGSGDTVLGDLGSLTQDISKPLPTGTIKVVCIGTKINQTAKASCNARAFNLCGTYSGTIDPVITTMEIGQGGSVLQNFTEIPSYERFVTVQNGVPGLKRLSVMVNGSTYVLEGLCDGETRTVDVGAAMIPGDANTVTLKGEGAAGTSAVVTIGDTATTQPMVVGEAVALRIEKSAGGLELSWPVAGAGLELQSRATLESQEVWTAWSETPQLVNGRYVVTVPGNPTRFFRLHKP